MSSVPGMPAHGDPDPQLGDFDDAEGTTDPGLTRISRRPQAHRAAAGVEIDTDTDHTLLGARPRPVASTSAQPHPNAEAATPARRATAAGSGGPEAHGETIIPPQSVRGRGVISGTHVPGADRAAGSEPRQRLAATPVPLGTNERYAARPAAPVIAARAQRGEPGVQPTVDPSTIDHALLDRTLRGRARRRAVGVILVLAGSCLLLATAVLLVISTFGH